MSATTLDESLEQMEKEFGDKLRQIIKDHPENSFPSQSNRVLAQAKLRVELQACVSMLRYATSPDNMARLDKLAKTLNIKLQRGMVEVVRGDMEALELVLSGGEKS